MRKMVLPVLCLALALLAVMPGMAEHEIIIDVADGRFVSGQYSIPLAAGVDKPVTLRAEAGLLYVTLETPDGPQVVAMGIGNLALTEAALPYVRIDDLVSLPGLVVQGSESCEICGKSLAIGRHYELECGHTGCLVTADHPEHCISCGKYTCNGQDHSKCKYCKQYWCNHSNAYCEYGRNPIPEAKFTTGPDGNPKRVVDIPKGAILVDTYDEEQTWTPALDRAAERDAAEMGGMEGEMAVMP